MNKDRRKAIAAQSELLQAMKGQLADIKSDIETLRDEEQEYLDNMPESMADGDKASAAQEAIDAMEAAMQSCENIETELDEAEQALETASA